MLKKAKYLLSFIILFYSFDVSAQGIITPKEKLRTVKHERINQMIRSEEEGIPSFTRQSVTAIKNHHDGWGVLFEKGFSKSPYKATLIQFELGEKQHRKEQKQSASAFFGRPFVYGKQNIFYQAKLGMGRQILLGGKTNKNGVAVYGIFVGGFSAGLLRPYYLEFDTGIGVADLKYQTATRDAFLNQDQSKRILGGTGLNKGWNEISFTPGIYAKASLRFDWARFNQVVSALEVGFMADLYSQRVVQMIDLPGKTFFPTGFISLNFGKRK